MTYLDDQAVSSLCSCVAQQLDLGASFTEGVVVMIVYNEIQGLYTSDRNITDNLHISVDYDSQSGHVLVTLQESIERRKMPRWAIEMFISVFDYWCMS